ncbi:MAG: phosphatase PAP2 family protein [Acidimicrobiia bacterium]
MPEPETHTSVDARAEAPSPRTRTIRFGGAMEAVGILWIYLVYSQLRAMAAGSEQLASQNARRLLRVEQFFGLSFERTVQELALRVDWVVAFWNLWYGTVHFVAPIAVLIILWRKTPARYVRMRNTLLITFALGLVLFRFFPLMPPRLMPPSYHYVDTGRQYFHIDAGLRSELGADDQPTTSDFAQGANDFAAMPSMHITWSTWVVLALWPLVRRRRFLQTLLVLYPLSILVCVTVTGNHWFLDAVGGWVVLAMSYRLALAIERVGIARRSASAAGSFVPSS